MCGFGGERCGDVERKKETEERRKRRRGEERKREREEEGKENGKNLRGIPTRNGKVLSSH